jgi:zinc transporter, ZIP family
MLGFAAEELLPESQISGNTDISASGLMVGFAVMMILDVALG